MLKSKVDLSGKTKETDHPEPQNLKGTERATLSTAAVTTTAVTITAPHDALLQRLIVLAY
eukprot:8077-Heterococcus_DN1.PRE.1